MIETARKIVLVVVLLISGNAFAGQTNCPAHYFNGTAPDIVAAKIAVRAQELCYDAFGVMHSGVARTPLWSAEYLTSRSLKGLKRVNAFHAEERLAPEDRAELADYAKSGWDRGHMAPSADMPTRRAQQQSFSLANMVPQDPDNNRNLWEGIESAVRTMARSQDLYVITGPLYLKESVKRLNGRVLVPTHVFKLLWSPKENRGAVYFAKNDSGNSWEAMSIFRLEKMSGIVFLPGVDDSIKKKMLDLPEPTPHNGSRAARGNNPMYRDIARRLMWNFLR